MMLLNGKISFRTCMSHARFPALYITTLTNKTYSSVSDFNEPPTFKEAFDFWFLTEIFSVIGEYNML